jgi:hypothetical protein
VTLADNGHRPAAEAPDHVQVALSAVNGAPNSAKPAIAAQAVNAAPDELKADVAAAALRAVPAAGKAGVVNAAARALPAGDQEALAAELVPDQLVTNQIWLVIVKTFAIVLSVSTVALMAALIASFWRTVDAALVQMVLTVFTTVAGILAGFVSGRSSAMNARR